MAKSKTQDKEITIMELRRARIRIFIRGLTPVICNAMSEKAKQQLLLPAKRKTAADKATTLKHDPLVEFRNSMYYARDMESSPTAVVFRPETFKCAIMDAAVNIPGTKKTDIGRLCYVEGSEIPIYGIPELHMSVVRSADMNRTPDVRTRAIIPQWAAIVDVVYTAPLITETQIANLVAAAGLIQGVGDWRTGKLKGNYGSFELCQAHEIQHIIKTGGRQAQIDAIANPICYDSETESLIDWYDAEVRRRGFKSVLGGAA